MRANRILKSGIDREQSDVCSTLDDSGWARGVGVERALPAMLTTVWAVLVSDAFS